MMIDRGRDALALSLRVLFRPLTNRLQRALGGAIPLGD